MIWLGETRGYLTDWVTQLWVRLTGRAVDLEREAWLAGPIGRTRGIGSRYFEELAEERGLRVASEETVRGLMDDFGVLASADVDPRRVDPAVIEFYEQASAYDLDAWSEWCGAFRPFGWLLAILFSRRLQQMNVPLSSLDTSRGMTSRVYQLIDPASGEIALTGWLRELVGTNDLLYAGCYSVDRVPGHSGPCVKVVFPLPNGNAIVLMRPQVHEDGSFSIHSSGRRFGDPGFYFTVHLPSGRVVARYVRTFRESIHVFGAESGTVRADHVLRIWGITFLRLHYRLRRRERARPAEAS